MTTEEENKLEELETRLERGIVDWFYDNGGDMRDVLPREDAEQLERLRDKHDAWLDSQSRA